MIGLGTIKSFYNSGLKAAVNVRNIETSKLQYASDMIFDTVTIAGKTKNITTRAMQSGVTPTIQKAASKAAEKANVLYNDVDMTQDGFELLIDGIKYALKGPQRKKLRKLDIGQTAHIGGGSSAENELFNICGLKVNHLTVTKNGENSFKVVNNFATEAKKAEKSALEVLESIKNSHPEFYGILKKEIDTGNINNNTLEVILDGIQNPITDINYTNAISHYKNEGYKVMNQIMRGEKLDNISDAYKIRIKKEMQNLTRCIDSKSYSKELNLYRGDRYSLLDNVIISKGKYQGQKLSDVLQKAENLPKAEKELLVLDISANNDIVLKQPSFLSTSLLKDVRPKKDKPIQFTFTTKGDIHGLCLDTNVKSCWENELEYLVQKNANMHVTNITPSEDGKWLFDAILNLS